MDELPELRYSEIGATISGHRVKGSTVESSLETLNLGRMS